MSKASGREDVVGLIYEAALDPEVWPRLADRLADLLHATVGQFSSADARTGTQFIVAPRLPPEVNQSYDDYWVHHNPLVGPTIRQPVGKIFSTDTVMSRSDFIRTAIYNEFFAPQELEESLGAQLLSEDSIGAMCSFWRPTRMGRFGPAEIELFAGLIPHLQRAMQIARRFIDLRAAQKASTEILDRLRQPLMLVDANSRVLFANRAAEVTLAAPHGLRRTSDAALRADRHAETVILHRLVAEAVRSPAESRESCGGRLRVSRGPESAPLIVLVVPLRVETDWLTPYRPVAIVLITDPQCPSEPLAANLRDDFGLTSAEAAVALEILNGHGLKTAAARIGVSPTTVRSHLTAVFDKTGVRRQAELVRVLLASGGAIRDK